VPYDDLPESPQNPIRRVRRAPHIINEHEWIFHHRMRVLLETGLGPIPPLLGMAAGDLSIQIPDPATGEIFELTMGDDGYAVMTNLGVDVPWPQPIYLLDIALYPQQMMVYQLVFDVEQGFGWLMPAPKPFPPFIRRLPWVTQPGGFAVAWTCQFGQIVNDPPLGMTLSLPPREPQVVLRWSDDAGHTWSNGYACGAGMAGNFKSRVEWRRLGRSRQRVYEISVSDAIPWRIVDAYLDATPGYEPQERYAKQLAKMA
jgi:hypothetical protein